MATFKFAAVNWRDLVRIAWAPVILSIVIEQVTQPIGRYYLAALASVAVHDTPALLYVIWQNLPALLTSLVANTLPWLILVSGVLRLVIRDERPALPFYLGSGMDEVRLFLTILLSALIDFLFQVCTAITLLAASYAAQAIPRVGALVSFAIITTAIFLAVRLYLRLSLMLPAAIAEKRLGVIVSLRVTRGNEMHLLGFWLVWTAIGLLCFAMFAWVVFSSAFISFQPTFNPAESSVGGHYNSLAAGRFDIATVPGFLLAALTWLLNALAAVLVAIAGGIAWRMIYAMPAPAETASQVIEPGAASNATP